MVRPPTSPARTPRSPELFTFYIFEEERMYRRFLFPVAIAVFVALPAVAQHPEERGQHPEEHAQNTPRAKPEPEHHVNGRVNSTPHVNNDHWYGHDSPNDKRFHVDHPYEHGRFEHFGPSYRYRVERFDLEHHRFWFPGGFGFEVASWDWPVCADWCWNCADDFVVY